MHSFDIKFHLNLFPLTFGIIMCFLRLNLKNVFPFWCICREYNLSSGGPLSADCDEEFDDEVMTAYCNFIFLSNNISLIFSFDM